MFCEEHFLLFNSTGDLFHCGDGGGRRGWLIYGNPLCADDICQAVISIAFLTETITTPPLQTDQNYDKHEAALCKKELSQYAFARQVSVTQDFFVFILPLSQKTKKRSQSKEGLTCSKRTRVRMHEACTHLLVSEPVGNCHMPGRFFNLARWCSAIRPTKSFNQSPVRHMKNLDLSWQFLLNQCACPLCIPLATFSKLSLFSLKPIPVPPCSWYGPNSFFVFPHFLQATITPLSLIIFLT